MANDHERAAAATPTSDKPANKLKAHAISFVSGLFIALALYYVLYRIALPAKPFIYVSF